MAEQRRRIKDLAEENSEGVERGGIYDQLNLVQQRQVYPVATEFAYTEEMIRFDFFMLVEYQCF